MRMSRRRKAGVINCMFAEVQIVRIKIEAVSLGFTPIKLHLDDIGALKSSQANKSMSN